MTEDEFKEISDAYYGFRRVKDTISLLESKNGEGAYNVWLYSSNFMWLGRIQKDLHERHRAEIISALKAELAEMESTLLAKGFEFSPCVESSS